MKIWFRINGFQPCSWTFVWNNLRIAFNKIGYQIPTDPFFPPSPIEEYVELWWCDPQHWKWSDQKVKLRAGIALSEANSILIHGRADVIDNINRCDLLLCPSWHASMAFKEAPIDVPIYVVPFGINKDEYSYLSRNWDSTFKFLHLGNTQFRKGSWLVPEAFIKAFSEKDDVKLTIACFAGNTPMFTQLKHEFGTHPQIEFTTEAKKSAVEYYKEHHVLLSPHLAEGFGLCIPEAMATGMPCIVSRCSSPREFFDKKYGWWCEMSEDYAPVSHCLVDTAGFWRIPDVNDLAKKMRYAYEHRKECSRKGVEASQYVRKNLTWTQTATKIVSILDKFIKGDPCKEQIFA